jgi:hypothetical protein
VDSGFGNSIYWTLTVATTFIQFTTLQQTNQTFYLLSSGFRTALPDRRIFTSISICVCICLEAQSANCTCLHHSRRGLLTAPSRRVDSLCSLSTERIEDNSPKSSIVTLCSYQHVRVENVASQLIQRYVLGSCCYQRASLHIRSLATDVSAGFKVLSLEK